MSSRTILSFRNITLTVIAAVLIAMTTGCGVGNLADSTPQTQTLTISGRVHGGEQPISGATVQLWETGTTGYGTGAAQLLASTTSALHTGTFTFTNTTITCSAGPGAYITASGGDPTGNTMTAQNHAILLVSLAGLCSSIGPSTNVDVDEVTTVATAYALGNFSKVTQSSGGVLATLGIGTPSTNTQGLVDAANTATTLAYVTNGQAATGSSSQYLPTAMLNTLADIIQQCVNASEYNVYPCADQTTPTAKSGLFTLTTPPGGTAPTNVFQAAMNMAKYPGNNVAALLALASGTPAFTPTVPTTTVTSTSAPNDLSLGIAYPNSTLATATYSPVGIAIDNSDNVWVLGAANGGTTSTYNYISELTSPYSGATYTNTLGSTAAIDGTHTLRYGQFDTLGNLWISDTGASAAGVVELPSASISGALEYTFGISSLNQGDFNVAVDASNNIWTASYGSGSGHYCSTATSGTICDYVEFPKGSTTPYTATNQFNSAAQYTAASRGIAVDAVSSSSGFGNIWTTNYYNTGGSTANNTVTVLKPSTGTLYTTTLGTSDGPYGIALDSSGGAYVTTTYSASTSGLYYIPQATSVSGTGSVSSTVSATGNATYTGIPSANTSSPASTATTPLAIGGLSSPVGVAVDGSANVFVANSNYGTIVEYNPTLSAYVSPYYGFSPNTTVPAQALTVTAVTLASGGTANIYYTGDTAINGQQVTFSGFPAGNYAFLNGNTYTITATSLNYFTISDGGVTSVAKTTVAGTATIPATTQATFVCGPNVTTTTTTTCTTVGNAASRNNAIAIDRTGTVWTLGTNGTLVGLIGTAAPTNPILAAGQSGSKP